MDDFVQDALQDYAQLPLPAYTRSWGVQLRRPTKLPKQYDTRIDPAEIFVYSRNSPNGDTEDVYITTLGCDHCKSDGQACSRGQPCSRCSERVIRCTYKEGYTGLPGPKARKSREAKKTADHDSGSLITGATSRSTGSTTAGGRVLRARQSVTSSASKITCPPPVPPTGKSDLRKTKNKKQQTHVVTAMAKKGQPAAPHLRKPRGKTANVSKHAPRKKIIGEHKLRQSAKCHIREKRPSKVCYQVTSANGTTGWRAIVPTPTGTVEGVISHASPLVEARPLCQHPPRVWASNKEELLQVIPPLVGGVNGISWKQSEMTTIIIEQQNWPQDFCDGSTIGLSMVREYTSVEPVPAGSLPNPARMPQSPPDDPLAPSFDPDQTLQDDFDHEMTLVDDIIMEDDEGVPLHKRLRRLSGSASTPGFPSLFSVFQNNGSSPGSPVFDMYASKHSKLQVNCDVTARRHVVRETTLNPNMYGVYQLPSPEQLIINHNLTGAFAMSDITLSRTERLDHLTSYMDHTSDVQCQWFSPRRASLARNNFGGDDEVHPIISRPFVPPIPMVNSMDFTYSSPTAIWQGAQTAESRDAFQPHTSFSGVRDTEVETALRMTPEALEHEERSITHTNARILDPAAFGSETMADNLSLPVALHPSGLLHSQEWSCAEPSSSCQESLEVHLPQVLPPDIVALLDSYSLSNPLSIIASRNSSLLPFALPEKYGYVFLGCFHIKDVQCKVESSVLGSDGRRTTRVCWQFKFVWIPGPEGADIFADPPRTPWWLAQRSELPARDDEEMQYSPFPLLPPSLLASPGFRDSASTATASEITVRKGWHCQPCGKLNVQRLLCWQKCSECSASNGVAAVGAMYVRNPYGMAPIAFPWDRYPKSVLCDIKDWPDRMGTFSYRVSDSAVLKHIFARNHKALQEVPSLLFREMQLNVELSWQSAQTALAAGPYFTYLAGVGHGPERAAMPWADVPECVSTARNLMQTLGQKHGEESGFVIDQLTVLAWHTTGQRKGSLFPAKGRSISLLCLGADVELSIVPRSGFAVVTDSGSAAPTAPSYAPPPSTSPDVGAYGDRDELNTMELDEEEDASFFDDIHTNTACLQQDILSGPTDGKGKGKADGRKVKSQDEALLITLVHGDMLMLAGDDFEFALKRTGMSIVLIGLKSDTS